MLDPFDILGLPPSFELDLQAAEKRYRDLSRVLHPDKHVGSGPGERRLALGKAIEVNEAWRLVRAYGTRVDRVLGQAKRREDVAPFFGPLSAAEVRYLMKDEWARTADDILWRRSKLGLKVAAGEKEMLARFMVQPG